MKKEETQVSNGGKIHIQAMLVLNLSIPAIWLLFVIQKKNLTGTGLIQTAIYYGLVYFMIQSIKKGNEKNRKTLGMFNLMGAIAGGFLIASGSNEIPQLYLLIITVVWGYTAWACLISKSLKQIKGEPVAAGQRR